MWPVTSITKKLGIQYPIIQAPMAGGATTPELVAAVSNAGGLGSFAAGYLMPDDIRSAIRKIRELTKNPFSVNLFIPEKHHVTADEMNAMCNILGECCFDLKIKIEPLKPPYSHSFEDQMNILLEENVPIFSFTFGIPNADWISKFKNKNTVLIGTATNLEEALLLEKNQIDFIVAQGSEAGDHRGTFIGKAEKSLTKLLSLIPEMINHTKTPIIAAGGIMDADSIMSAMKLGASAVQMGTAFLSCYESGIHPKYKEKLLTLKNDETTLTRAFSGKMARGIKNKFITLMELHANHIEL
jgi:nitronate monooxygenase